VTSRTLIRQAYLNKRGNASIRVRIRDNASAQLTIKSRGADLRRLELEYDIPVIEAEAMLALRSGAIIEKHRNVVPFEGMTWEVDTFLGDNAGLVIAELELQSEQQTFERPPWLGAEITLQASYYNGALANHPYGHWTHDERMLGTS
jgi:adenylate cyclase